MLCIFNRLIYFNSGLFKRARKTNTLDRATLYTNFIILKVTL
jgi:hypothetical protein